MSGMIDAATLKKFSEKCDTLCASKLILSGRKISDILKTITAGVEFCALIEHCLKGFHYRSELLAATAPNPERKGKFTLTLPSGEKLIAFVFCLLCDFDNGEIELTEFLTEYFGHGELYTDAFKNFCGEVVIPFKNAVIDRNVEGGIIVSAEVLSAPGDLSLLRGGVSEPPFLEVEQPEAPEGLTDAEEAAYAKAYFGAVKALDALSSAALREKTFAGEKRAAISGAVKALKNALAEGDGRYAPALYGCLRLICGEAKGLRPPLQKTDEAMRSCKFAGF